MDLRQVNTCTNCENLSIGFNCIKHEKKVDLNNVCDSHIAHKSLTTKSSCTNCYFLKKEECKHPTKASEGMLCFSWKNNA